MSGNAFAQVIALVGTTGVALITIVVLSIALFVLSRTKAGQRVVGAVQKATTTAVFAVKTAVFGGDDDEPEQPRARQTTGRKTATLARLEPEPGTSGYGTIVIDKEEFFVGASNEYADAVLSNNYVSKRHVLIQQTNKGFMVSDQASRNGTFVDGTRLPENGSRLVADGTRISIGPEMKYVFRVEQSAISKTKAYVPAPGMTNTFDDAAAAADPPRHPTERPTDPDRVTHEMPHSRSFDDDEDDAESRFGDSAVSRYARPVRSQLYEGDDETAARGSRGAGAPDDDAAPTVTPRRRLPDLDDGEDDPAPKPTKRRPAQNASVVDDDEWFNEE